MKSIIESNSFVYFIYLLCRVPDKDPSGRSLVLDPREYSRIKDNARILTDEELRTIEEFHRTQKEKTQKERFEREQFMKKKDLQREKAESLLVLEGDAKANAQDLLSKANESKQEQEQEIKYLNEVSDLVSYRRQFIVCLFEFNVELLVRDLKIHGANVISVSATQL